MGQRKYSRISCETHSNRVFSAKEIGYIINKHYQRKGYAREALQAVVAHAFRSGVHRVFAECDPRNDASWRLLKRTGFRREAHFRRNIYFRKGADGNPVWKDTYVYAMTEVDTDNPKEINDRKRKKRENAVVKSAG